jgi:2-phospho-L-lactate transferase/gluconeogenesis factor (CofD/UPF0052 family)
MPKDKTGKPQNNWQPIAMLPKIAEAIDGMLAEANKMHKRLTQAKLTPHILDNVTVDRLIRAYEQQKTDLSLFEEQLRHWQTLALETKQKAEVERLQGELSKLDDQIRAILTLVGEIKKGTIDQVMAVDDPQRALEFLAKQKNS